MVTMLLLAHVVKAATELARCLIWRYTGYWLL